MIKVVTGLRRSGKSYLLFKLFSDYLIAEGVPEDHIIKVNLEDRRNKTLRNPDELLAYLDAQFKDDKMHYILLDEVQMVSEFEERENGILVTLQRPDYVRNIVGKSSDTPPVPPQYPLS